jgi:N-acetylglucosaminyldiphosphoundecaprenol N-acetyl-beta-D-mannosaminyltransferase
MDGRLPAQPHRVRLLGGEVDLVTPVQVLAFAQDAVTLGRKVVIANHNLHSLCLVRRDPEMAAFYERADLIEVDSAPLIAWGKLMRQPISRTHRSTYLGWRDGFWRAAVHNRWRVFYLGGAPGVAQAGAANLRGRWPGADIAVHHGYFDADGWESEEVLAKIAGFRPDVLLVGMGSPRQEIWTLRALEQLPACVIFTVGAAFDYEAGAVALPPPWTSPLGLERLWRSLADPRRLFSYLVEPWSLLPALAEDVRAYHAPSARSSAARSAGSSAPMRGSRSAGASLGSR